MCHEDLKLTRLDHVLQSSIIQSQIRYIDTDRHIHSLTRGYHDLAEALESFVGTVDTAEDVADVELDDCGAVDGAAVRDGKGGRYGGGGGCVGEGEGDVAVGEGCVGELEGG